MFANQEDAVAHFARQGFTVEYQSTSEVILVRTRRVGFFWNLVLSVLTSGFWLIVWGIRLATRRKVIRLRKTQAGLWSTNFPSRVNRTQDFVSIWTQIGQFSKPVKMILAGTVVAVLILTFAVYAISSTRKLEIAKVTSSKVFSEVSQAFNADFCKQLETDWANDSGLISANLHGKVAARAIKTLTFWTGKAFVERNSWVSAATKSIEIEKFLDRRVSSAVTSALAGKQGTTVAQAWAANPSRFMSELRSNALTKCQLSGVYERNFGLLSTFQADTELILGLAAGYPWYPKGYSEIAAFPGFAYKNQAGNQCSYGASCASFGIVSETACPTSLYVEVNMLDASGAIVDWSNDTAQGLKAGQVARMAANSYNSNFSSWQFAKIHCY